MRCSYKPHALFQREREKLASPSTQKSLAMFTVFFATSNQVWSLRNLQSADETAREFTELRLEQTAQIATSLTVILQGNLLIAACEDVPRIDSQIRIVHCQYMHRSLTPDLRRRYHAIFNRTEFRYVR